MTKERVILAAHQDANRSGKTLAVLNLNMIGAPLYVIREMMPDLETSKRLVCVVRPETIVQGA